MSDPNAICEYCRMIQRFYLSPFQKDHIIARKHRGGSERRNLATACFHCNNHKGSNIAGIDPRTKRLVRLFNPRRDKWTAHFRWQGIELVGITSIGRTTVEVLRINDERMVKMRRVLIAQGLFPPT